MKAKTFAILGVYTVVFLQYLQGIVLAGPTNRRSSRMVREVYPEIETEKLEGNQAEVCIVGDVVYGAEEPVPADQPCLKCKCQPPGVQCETTRCIKKPGCKAIHKPNKCCPEYQCECEHEGRSYANGERLETPLGGECRVCYCRGGEVQCADVSCYIRTDCEGRTVPGQCCPKYDHCPPREPLVGRIIPSYTTQHPEISSYRSSTTVPSVEQTTTVYDQVQDITDDDSNKITESLPEDRPTQTESLKEGQLNSSSMEKKEAPKITIQEIIPEIKEIPITGPPKREINLESKVSNKVDDVIDQDREEDDLALTDADSDSSEISEVYHQPPPVLKIGDQLLFLKKGEFVSGKDISTPLPVITIIGAEGLQRGIEDSGEAHETHPQSQDASTPPQSTHVISLVKPKSTDIEDTTQTSLSTIEDFLMNLTKSISTDTDDDWYSKDSDPNTTIMMENIVNKIRTLTNVESTTDVAHLIEKVYIADVNETEINDNDSNSTEWYETKSLGNDTSEEERNTTIFGELEDVDNTTQSIPVQQVTTEMKRVSARYEDLGESIKPKHDEELSVTDQNPEYPPIPDIMSPQNIDELTEHIESELAQLASEEPSNVSSISQIGSTSLELLTTAEKEEERQNKTGKTVLHPLINQDASLPTSLLIEVAPSDLEDEREEETTVSPQTTTEESEKSRETMEDSSQESDEFTTPKNRHASIMLSVEDASVESTHGESEEFDTTDLVETLPGYQVKSAQPKEQNDTIQTTSLPALKKEDVEIMDLKAVTKAKDEGLLYSNVKSMESKSRESKIKSHDSESDNIFKQLNEELKTVPSNMIDINKTEEGEAEAIFKELLEEATSTTTSATKEASSPQPQQKESQLLQKVSDVITKFQTKESKQSLDASILSIIKDFFSAQYKYYGSNTKK